MFAKGLTVDIDIPPRERFAEVEIGRGNSFLDIPVKQIENSHLNIRLKREREADEYEITIRRGGAMLIKPDTGKDFIKVTSSETFYDKEIKNAGGLRFRLGERVRDDQMKAYVEIGLNWDLKPDERGRKRKKFFVTVEDIKGELEKTDEEGLYSLYDPDSFY